MVTITLPNASRAETRLSQYEMKTVTREVVDALHSKIPAPLCNAILRELLRREIKYSPSMADMTLEEMIEHLSE